VVCDPDFANCSDHSFKEQVDEVYTRTEAIKLAPWTTPPRRNFQCRKKLETLVSNFTWVMAMRSRISMAHCERAQSLYGIRGHVEPRQRKAESGVANSLRTLRTIQARLLVSPRRMLLPQQAGVPGRPSLPGDAGASQSLPPGRTA
jgi:hypothetical protein